MNTFYGVWTPTSGALPDVEDFDFAAYYITESGSVPGNSTSFVKDNWLIYICEARGTLSERSYWRVTNGIVLFKLIQASAKIFKLTPVDSITFLN